MSEYILLIIVLLACAIIEKMYIQECNSFFDMNLITNHYVVVQKRVANNKNNKWLNHIALISISSIIIIIYSVRDLSVGTDTLNYNAMFNSFDICNYAFDSEPMFWIITLIIKSLGLSFDYLLLVVSFIFTISVLKISNTHLTNNFFVLFLIVTLGLYFIGMNIMRQFLALSFFMLSFDSIKKRKPIEFVIYCVFAILSHNSAIVLLPMYLINYLKPNYKVLILAFAIILVGIFCIEDVVKLICKFISRNYYASYIANGFFSGSVSLIHLCYNIGLICLLFWLFYIQRYVLNCHKKEYELLLLIFVVCVIFRTIGTFTRFSIMLNRISLYFIWPLAILLPYSIKIFPFAKLNKIYEYLIYVCAICYFYLTIVISQQAQVVPYLTCFQNGSLGDVLIHLCIVGFCVVAVFSQIKKWLSVKYKKINLYCGKC